MDNRGEDRKDFAGRRSFRKDDREYSEKRRQSGENFRPRRFDRNEGDHRETRREQGNREGFRPRGDKSRNLGAIMDIDNDILHLIIRRAQMISRLRNGGRLAPETEKTLRTAWENKAARLARDNRVSRDLFVLLQSIEPLTRMEEEQGYYNLAPNGEAVDIQIPAPSDSIIARCWLAIAAASGQVTKISRIPLTDAVVNSVKILNQIGGQLWWEDNGDIQSRGGTGLIRNIDKVIHAGSDAFNLWLLIALCLGMPARLKITGDSALRFLDLAPLRHFLPQLGVRLTNVIPSQDGLPIRLECSGLVPPQICIAEDLPEDFIAALVLASPFWETSCRITLPKKAPRLLDTVVDILTLCGASVSQNGHDILIERGNFTIPAQPIVPMDVSVAASVLMFPGFNGGKAVLQGDWGKSHSYILAEKILRDAGLAISCTPDAVICSGKERETTAPSSDILKDVIANAPELLPLCTVIIAAAIQEGMEISLPEFTDEDHHLITAFLARCGIEEQEGKLLSTEQTVSGSWMAPSAQWAMAYGLCAFLRPNLHLSNPGIMTSLFPSFWNMYNTLPHPELKRRTEQEPQDVKPVRRRVIAQGVYGELPPDTTPGDDF